MSEPDDTEGGFLGAVIISFLILLAAIAMTFVVYVLLDVS